MRFRVQFWGVPGVYMPVFRSPGQFRFCFFNAACRRSRGTEQNNYTVRFSIAGAVQTTARKWPVDRMRRLATVLTTPIIRTVHLSSVSCGSCGWTNE
jgi:hypothetical protein